MRQEDRMGQGKGEHRRCSEGFEVPESDPVFEFCQVNPPWNLSTLDTHSTSRNLLGSQPRYNLSTLAPNVSPSQEVWMFQGKGEHK